ncbi:DUF2029 domain-containing protein [bacterium]|nr:DUF2029 domain-containing protein [bacterium]
MEVIRDFVKTLRSRIDRSIVEWILYATIAGVVISFGITARDPGHLHDFISYYFGTLAISKGVNGYSADAVSHLFGQPLQSHLRFVYPPQMSWIFRPFTWISYPSARTAFITVKVILALGFLWMGISQFKPTNGNLFLMGLIALFGFHGTIGIDIASGNIGILEALLFWGGIALLLKNKPVWAGAAIALGASFKLTPIVLLLPFLIFKQPSYRRMSLSGLAVFIFIQLVGYLSYPSLFREFITSTSPLDSSGFVNPSSLAFIRFSLAPRLAALSGGSIFIIERLIYLSWVAICGIGLTILVKFRKRISTMEFLSGLVLIYAMAMPRFKDYTFVLLIIPAWWIVSQIETTWLRWGMVALICMSLWPYHHLMMIILMVYIILHRVSTASYQSFLRDPR